MTTFSLFKTAFTTGNYYKAMNNALKKLDGSYQMLHYPYHDGDNSTIDQGQQKLIQYCTSYLTTMKDQKVLDLGCGNGTVAFSLAQNYDVDRIVGVDLNTNNIRIANIEKERRNSSKVKFIEDDAQKLAHIADNSFDVVINIESAFHYPHKHLFLNEIYRVLRPGGQFIIADILTIQKRKSLLKKWKKKMNFHHWSLDDYMDAFEEVKLNLVSKDDISRNVIEGFQRSLKYMNNKSVSQLVKLFFFINVKLSIYLLKKKRAYYVFYGRK
ncbi:MAG: class I SAM-dependent methyltransferase, partial [Bacteroidales bacterium]|nr:class I SAM-dependent methyltransferase [Bacteroidales bacterium]